MKARSARITSEPKLMIIPLIDIMFFLLVFFIFSTLQMVEQKSMPVQLPQAASAHQEEVVPVSVTLSKDGKILLENQPVTIEELGSKLYARLAERPDVPVILRADKSVEHGHVVEVMDELKAIGVTKLSIAAEAKRR